jgi:hypothetical protein
VHLVTNSHARVGPVSGDRDGPGQSSDGRSDGDTIGDAVWLGQRSLYGTDAEPSRTAVGCMDRTEITTSADADTLLPPNGTP